MKAAAAIQGRTAAHYHDRQRFRVRKAQVDYKNFTDSYASWQKGAVENANKLVRQYITKEMDISKITDKSIAAIQSKINAKPRKKLNFNTPKHEFYKHFT